MSPWDARFLVSKYLRCTFLHVFAHCMYLRYTNTCYKVLTFNSTDFLFLNTVLHTTDLIIHDFELHELFNSPKNVHLKALLYQNLKIGEDATRNTKFLQKTISQTLKHFFSKKSWIRENCIVHQSSYCLKLQTCVYPILF